MRVTTSDSSVTNSAPGAPRLLMLDTHIWVWANGKMGGASRFRTAALAAIEIAAAERRLIVSAASVWEIALKSQKGDLLLTGDLRAWVRDQSRHPGVRVMAMNSALAIDATTLPLWVRKADGKPHKDPGDHFIVAEARRRNAVLVTCDEVIIDYARAGHVNVYDVRLAKRS